MSVIRLVDHAPSAVSGQEDMFHWLREWTVALESGEYGEFRSMVLVVEDRAGNLGSISQSLNPMDTARVVGLLSMMAVRKANGEGNIMDMRQ